MRVSCAAPGGGSSTPTRLGPWHQAYWASRRDLCIRVTFAARSIARTRAINSGATIAVIGATSPLSTAVPFIDSVIIIGTGFFGVVGTDITRSRTSEVSFRSVDAGRMLDQSRWCRHCPAGPHHARAMAGSIVQVRPDRSAGSTGASGPASEGDGERGSGTQRGEPVRNRPQTGSVCACDLRGSGRPQDNAAADSGIVVAGTPARMIGL